MRVVAASVLLLAGCGSAPPVTFPGPASVEVGSSDDRFAPLIDGQAVPIVHGLQGGFHVWGAVRASWLDPRRVTARFTVGLDDGSPPLTVRDDVFDLDGTSDGLTPGTHVGTTVFLPDPALVRDRPCRLALKLTDRAGRSGSDTHRILPVDPP